MTSFLDRLKAKMSNSLTKPLFARLDRTKTRHNVVANRWDEQVWQAARQSRPVDRLIDDLALGDEHRGGQRPSFEAAPELVRDLWMALYKAAPQLEDKRDIERASYPARKVLEELLANPQLQELHEMTGGDPVLATVSLEAMAEQVTGIVGRIPPPPPPPQPGGGSGGDQPNPGAGPDSQPGDGGPDAEAGQQAQERDENEPGEGEGGPGEEDLSEDGDAEDFDPNAEADQAEADWQAAYDDLLNEVGLDRAVRKAVEAAAKDAGELDTARRGIGIDDGTWSSMSPQERMKAAERLRTPEMRELADIIGRMKRFALGVRASRINDVPHEAFDVEQGNDLRRLLRGEYALLGTPETAYEFYRRYADRELLQFKMRGHEPAGKGPIVTCVDKSYSMAGQPFMWAVAVAETLRRFAADEERDYEAIYFGTNHDRHRFSFPKGAGAWEKVMAFLSPKADGGTDFDGVLTEALKLASVAFDGEAKGKADIVFITDGNARLTPEWIEQFNTERQRVGVRVFSVYIGGASDMSYAGGPVGLLNKVSDVVISVKDLNPASAKQIFVAV